MTDSVSAREVWKERYRARVVAWTQPAASNRSRALAASNRTGVTQLYAWDVETNELRQLTKKPEGLVSALRAISGHDEIPGVPDSLQAMMISSRLDGLFSSQMGKLAVRGHCWPALAPDLPPTHDQRGLPPTTSHSPRSKENRP